MVEEHKSFQEYSQDDLDQVFKETLDAAKRIHSKTSSLAEDAGYIVLAISSAKPQLDELLDKANYDPSIYPIVAGAIETLRNFKGELISLDNSMGQQVIKFGPTVNSIATFYSSTGSGTALFNPDYELEEYSPPPNRESREYYSAKLKRLNSTLANSYDEVWQTYFGTSSDPHRAALFMMRTLFDNFFAWIAPDDEVRNSKFWKIKKRDNPKQIWRSERRAFALVKNIKDNSRRTLLESQSKQISDLYEAANEAHSRGSLDEVKASRTLYAMDSLLKDWIDSLN